MMTRQEVFDKVAKHLLAQNAKAMIVYGSSPNPRCAYRTHNGFMCAAGCLIDDKYYRPDFEGQGSRNEGVEAALIASGMPEDARDLVARLQGIHDNFEPEEWTGLLKNVAYKCDLTWNQP